MQDWWLVSYLALWGFVLLQTLLLIALVHHIGNLRLWLRQAGILRDPVSVEDGIPLGTRIDTLEDSQLDGHDPALGKNNQQAKLLLFVPAGFFGCDNLIPAIKEFETQYGHIFQSIIISFEPAVKEQFEVARHAGIQAPIITEQGWKLAQSFQVLTAPYALIVDKENVVRAKWPVGDSSGLAQLIENYNQNTNTSDDAEGE